jgi:hypothetical protein
MATAALTQLLEKMFAGDERALARLMTFVERDGEEVGAILQAIAPKLGNAFTIGVTVRLARGNRVWWIGSPPSCAKLGRRSVLSPLILRVRFPAGLAW